MANPKKVLMICGDYMEDSEAMVPFQALQAYGLSVDAVCPGKKSGDICRTAIHQGSPHQTYSESRGHNFTLNATFDEIDANTYDGLVLPGGRAPEYLAMNESVLNLVTHFAKSGKPIASICHGQLILAAAAAKADVIKGRKVTAYATVGPVLAAAGAHWVQPETLASCTVDGNLITAASYVGHPEFIRHFIKALGATVVGSNKRILFLCGDYMEDYEVMVPFQSLEALECCYVDAVCPKKKAGDTCPTAVHDFEGDQTYSEKTGHDFTLTANFHDVDASTYDALVIPGGRAPEYLALDPTVIKLVKHFMDSGKPVASICHGQQILSAAGVLKAQISGEAHQLRFSPSNGSGAFPARFSDSGEILAKFCTFRLTSGGERSRCILVDKFCDVADCRRLELQVSEGDGERKKRWNGVHRKIKGQAF